MADVTSGGRAAGAAQGKPRGKGTKTQVGMLKAWAWLEDRMLLRQFRKGFREFMLRINMQFPVSHTERYNLRIIWYWYPLYTLGSMALLAFLLTLVSGVILALYYTPSTAAATVPGYDPEITTVAWKSVVDIYSLPFGFMIRQIHFWAAMVMVAAVCLHLLRVYFTQAYKKPREVNWLIGVLLLVLTLGLGYTGYLLPWSQLSFWAGRIGLEMALATPMIGEWAAGLVFGSQQLGAATLTRMYILHVFVLPATILGVIGLHILIVWIQGIAEPH